jgi:hypothetical protein
MLPSTEATSGTPTEKPTVSDVLNVVDVDQFLVLETSCVSVTVTSKSVVMLELLMTAPVPTSTGVMSETSASASKYLM